jgi:hypothetical protein
MDSQAELFDGADTAFAVLYGQTQQRMVAAGDETARVAMPQQHRGGEASILLLHAKHINEISGRAANGCHV